MIFLFQVVFGRERETEETLGAKKRIPFSDESKALAAQLVSEHIQSFYFTKFYTFDICYKTVSSFRRHNSSLNFGHTVEKSFSTFGCWNRILHNLATQK